MNLKAIYRWCLWSFFDFTAFLL